MDAQTAKVRPITIAVVALGGEGGGVLADWIVDLANHGGYLAQATSVPGVAQRTGATVYYVELFPKSAAQAAGLHPRSALGALYAEGKSVLGPDAVNAAHDGDPAGTRRHPVRPRRGHLRLDAPRLLTRVPGPGRSMGQRMTMATPAATTMSCIATPSSVGSMTMLRSRPQIVLTAPCGTWGRPTRAERL